MTAPKRITLLGATGSIGCSTLDVIARHPDWFQVFALSGHRNMTLLAEQCRLHKPQYVAVPDDAAKAALASLLDASLTIEILVGAQALADIAKAAEVDLVMAAIVGAAGMPAALAAAQAGKTVLLANKETLVMTGELFMQAVRDNGATLLPIDSEHNAIFQCWPSRNSEQQVSKICLTASGGPFRGWTAEQLATVTPEQAVAHPNWSMGRKISVDSASMMNKGLELIEACWLFDLPPGQVDVVVHPQSIVHSMVYYHDGSVLAQMGNPDMRTPIAYALSWPEKRIDSGVAPLDLAALGRLDFQAPDNEAFPCLNLARIAIEQGGELPTALNAANEIAVEAFLQGGLGFSQIPKIIERTLNQFNSSRSIASIDEALACDQRARSIAQQQVAIL